MRKGMKKPAIAAAAVFAAVLAACLAASALYAPVASSMYVSEETFSGEVEEYHDFGSSDERSEVDSGYIRTEYTASRHNAADWKSLNTLLDPNEQKNNPSGWDRGDIGDDGVYHTVTIDVGNGNFGSGYPSPNATTSSEYYYIAYYLSDDLTCDIKITQSLSSKTKNCTTYIYLCLNGHVLRGTGNGGVITSSSSSSYPVVINILDCGGSGGDHTKDNVYGNEGDGCYDHYYRYMYDYADEEVDIGVVDGAMVPAGYVFYEYVQYEDYLISGDKSGSGYIDEDGNLTEDRGYYVLDEYGERIPVSEEDADGCIRGGLITGGVPSSDGGGISVGSYVTLNMYGGTVAGNWASEGHTACGIYVGSHGTFNMYGGIVEGNSTSYHLDLTSGGAVYESDMSAGGVGLSGSTTSSNKSVFNMYGGEIKNNYTCTDGGGVGSTQMSGDSATVEFNMYGGTISGNYAGRYGGGVRLYAGSFNMYGGTIRDNFAESGGGGIEAVSRAYILIAGGTVTGNRVLLDGLGGGIYVSGSSTLTLGGSSYVYGNHYGNYLGEYGDGRASEGRTSNIEWSSDWVDGSAGDTPVIKLSGELEEGVRIGISPVTGSSGDVVYRYRIVLDESDTNALSDYVKYFFADGQGMSVRLVTEDETEYLEIFSKR